MTEGAAVLAAARRYHRRVGVLRLDGDETAGYLFPYMNTFLPRHASRRRAAATGEPEAFLAWADEFTHPTLRQNGYGDTYGQAEGPEAIAETVRDWDDGIDASFGRVFRVEWLPPDRGAEVWRAFGPQDVPDSFDQGECPDA